MLINRDYVGHMAAEVIKKLGEGELVEVKNAAAVTQRKPGRHRISQWAARDHGSQPGQAL